MINFINAKKAVALGTFDGLHIGHMSVINRAVIQRNNGLFPLVLLFYEHPQKFLTGKAPKELLTGQIKHVVFSHLGCDVERIAFDEIKDMSPEEFVRDILSEKLNAGFVCCGFNYHFGKNGSGDTQTLAELCKKYNIAVEIVPEVDYMGEPVSSTRIRKAVADGDIENANAMLGRDFGYDFRVVTGDRRGHTLGFPTINQFFPESFAVPKYGVYAGYSVLGGKAYPAMTNIGVRPTIGNSAPRSETCILGYSGNLYGQSVPVFLLKYLRPEIKFNSLSELQRQMEKDASRAKREFESNFNASVQCTTYSVQ